MKKEDMTHKLEDLPDKYLQCRVFGHSWDQIPPTLSDRLRLFRHYIVARCTSCGTERHDGINAQGEVGQREYRHPKGYQTSFSLDRKMARLELLRRRGVSKRVRKRASA